MLAVDFDGGGNAVHDSEGMMGRDGVVGEQDEW